MPLRAGTRGGEVLSGEMARPGGTATSGGTEVKPSRSPRWAEQHLVVCAALLSLLGAAGDWLQKLPCRDVSRWAREGGIFNATHACYTDPVGLAQRYRLPTGALPFRDYALEYPAGTGYVVAGLSRFATDVGGSANQIVAHYWDATTLVLAAALFVIVLAVGRMSSRPLPTMVLVALGPLMLAEAGLNWDLLAVAPAVGAVAAWRLGHRGRAGLALGVGAAVKLFPLALLVAGYLAIRHRGSWRELIRPAAAAVTVFVALQLPGYLAAGSFADDGNGRRVAGSAIAAFRHSGVRAFGAALSPYRSGGVNGSLRFYLLSLHRPADLDSTPHVLDTLSGHQVLTGNGLTLFTAVCFIVLLAAGVRIRSPGPDATVVYSLLVLVALLASNKVWSPQYSLWLLPFIVLAGLSWRRVLLWQAVEVGTWIARAFYYQHRHDGNTGITGRDYAVVLAVRLGVVLALTVTALRQRQAASAPRMPALADETAESSQ